jgi:hydrogenase nickel incorporation protein HypA/HybF
MHEYSIVGALVARATTEAKARGATAVTALEVRIGELAGVEPELLATAWTTFRERTICADAPLRIVTVPARWVCSHCGTEIRRGGPLRCFTCARPARLAAGDEIHLDRIELEVPDV